MFAQKTAVLLAVLATVAPALAFDPYTAEEGLYAREAFDDLYIRDVDDFDFEMQKREVIENYLSAREDLESLLYTRSKLGDERTAIKDQGATNKAKGAERKLVQKEKAEEKALKKTEAGIKKDKSTVKKDQHKENAAQRKVGQDFASKKKGKRSFFDDLQIEW